MREHYGLDKLSDAWTELLDETTAVVNPAHRKLDGQVRKKAALLTRARASWNAMTFTETSAPGRMERYQQKLAEIKEHSGPFGEGVGRAQGAAESHTIKMIAYRAETAMANLLKECMSRKEDTRSEVRNLYLTTADVIPDEKAGTLTVFLHPLANQSNDTAVETLLAELNATETLFPGTNLRLVFKWGSACFHRDQDV